jgi:CubicO group peptidase (beta-lactamase class C family)
MKNKTFLPLLITLCATLFCVVPAHTQAPEWPYRHTVDSLLALQKTNIETPGFALCVVENGRIVYEKYAGAANIAEKIPITEKTKFNIGSIAKQFTAMCILLLEEDGKLKRSDDIHLYLPELPDYGYPITIRHLIGHTSGLRDYTELLAMQNKSSNKRMLNAQMLAYQHKAKTLNFPPGDDFNYSNTGYMMLSSIVERVSGLSLQDYAQQHIFGPLGMRDTYFQIDGVKGVAGGTTGYDEKAGEKKFKKEALYVDALGATGVHTTLRDMVLWDQNFYHNILGKGRQDLITKMETSDTLNSGLPTYYGGGVFLRHDRGVEQVEHTGGWGTFLAQYRCFPQQHISIISASNAEHPNAFVVNNIVYDAIFKVKPLMHRPGVAAFPVGISPELFAGIYLSDNNFIRKVQSVDGALVLVMGTDANATKRRLHYVETRANRIIFEDSLQNPLEFYLKNGQINEFRWFGGHYFPNAHHYTKVDETSAADPAGFAGRYRTADFGRNIKVKYHKHSKRLTVHPFPFVKYRLKPVAGNVYKMEGEAFLVRFSANQLIIGDLWNRGFVFERRAH